MEQRVAPHPTHLCSQCAFYHGQLGDRDKTIRDLMAEANRNRKDAEDLQRVREVLDQAGVPASPDEARPETKYSVVGRLQRLIERGGCQ